MNKLEQSILDLIKEVYKVEYTGGLKVTKRENGYILKLYYGNPDECRIQIAADMNEEDFLKYIKKELISRQLIRSKIFKLVNYDEKRGTC